MMWVIMRKGSKSRQFWLESPLIISFRIQSGQMACQRGAAVATKFVVGTDTVQGREKSG